MAIAHESYLLYRHSRWAKLSVLLTLACIVAYVAWTPLRGHNGGTWLGYTLGTIAALLIVWLMLFGIRKRRYGPGHWSLQGWLSAHVYLGLSLVVIATLHAAFQVGLNIHTLAYALMLVVILSGLFGILLYGRLPRLMTANRAGLSFDAMARQVLELDRQCAELALGLGDEVVEAVRHSRDDTRIGGSLWQQVRASDAACATRQAFERIEQLARGSAGADGHRMDDLLTTLKRKSEMLRRMRADIRYKALLDIWLYFHVPLSFALLAALLAHIISVFFYWG